VNAVKQHGTDVTAPQSGWRWVPTKNSLAEIAIEYNNSGALMHAL